VTKIGVIGAGVLGCHHIRKCLARPDVDLVGFVELRTPRAGEVASRHGLRRFPDVETLAGEVDGMIVATPSSTHVEIGGICLDAGVHLLVEKPLAESSEGGRVLVEKARGKGLVLHVGHSEAFNPAFGTLMRSADKPRFMEIHRLAEFTPRGTDVSVILDLMVHDIHLLRRLCGDAPLPERIAATGVSVITDDVDIANVRLPFSSGCVANLTASRISARRMRKLRMFQHDAYFSADFDTCRVEEYRLKRSETGGRFPVMKTEHTGEESDALALEVEAFVEDIRLCGRREGVHTTGEEAVEVLKVTDAILKKIHSGDV